MSPQEQQSILTIALLAGFADGHKADSEREAIRRMADSLGQEDAGAGLPRLYQDVLLKRVSLATSDVRACKTPGSASWLMRWRCASAMPMADKASLNAHFWRS